MPTYLHADASLLAKLCRLNQPRARISAQGDTIIVTTGYGQKLPPITPDRLHYDYDTGTLAIAGAGQNIVIEKCPRQVYQAITNRIAKTRAEIAERITKNQAEIIERVAKTQAAQAEASQIARLANNAHQAIRQYTSSRHWMSFADLNNLRNLAALPPGSRDELILECLTPVDREICRELNRLAEPEHARTARNEHNAAYLARAIPHIKQLAADRAGLNLTDEQAQAVAVNEPSTRIMAAAGSGKTAVIVAKAIHLQNDLEVPENRIRLLAYNRKAAQELRQRLDQADCRAPADTFHRFAMNIIAEVTGAQPQIHPLANDDHARTIFYETQIRELAVDPRHSQKIMALLLEHGHEYRSMWDFADQAEYERYVKTQELRTLNGELVKSHEELVVANHLAQHGIEYQYEPQYPHKTADRHRRQYQPDFYLPAADAYLEHFALDEQGNPPPGWTGYAEGVAWKRELHQQNGTRLIETHSWHHKNGTLTKVLDDQMKQLGIPLQPRPPAELLNSLTETGTVSRTARLIRRFDDMVRANGATTPELKAQTAHAPEPLRARAFIDAYEILAERYDNELRKEKAHDFHQLIQEAAQYVTAGRYANRHRHLLVDEFQDISLERLRLLQALKETGSHIYIVGDDWQSIYAFAGARVDLFTKSPDHLGPTQTVTLTRTFRANAGITAPAHRFIAQNPAQSQRTINPAPDVTDHGITVVYAKSNHAGLRMAQEDLKQRAAGAKVSTLTLGRYRNTRNDLPVHPDRFSTVHAAKGREDDYVIVCDLNNGRYGFPSLVEDDPLLRLAQPDAAHETTPHAEERRLFYVAITRAKRGAYIIADAVNPSPFATELAQHNPEVRILGQTATVCPICSQGVITRRAHNNRVFFVCTAYHNRDLRCAASFHLCPRCNQAPLVVNKPGDPQTVCRNRDCGHRGRACPKCRTGTLQSVTGPSGVFIGCSNYRHPEIQCRHSENPPDEAGDECKTIPQKNAGRQNAPEQPKQTTGTNDKIHAKPVQYKKPEAGAMNARETRTRRQTGRSTKRRNRGRQRHTAP